MLHSLEIMGKHGTDVFSMFLTVLFASLGFAASFSLKEIGKTWNFGWFKLSSSSFFMGLILLAFYAISYITFANTVAKARILQVEISSVLSQQKAENLEKIVPSVLFQSAFKPPNVKETLDACIPIDPPRFGYILGALGGLWIFLWIANVKRLKDKDPSLD
jgi:hypothetical protein